jgi:hypothetical protein
LEAAKDSPYVVTEHHLVWNFEAAVLAVSSYSLAFEKEPQKFQIASTYGIPDKLQWES